MSEPFILVEKGNYISRVWTFHAEGAAFDVLMVLSRKLPDGDWRLDYRFRYYRDDETFDSEDQKSYWSATFPEKLDEAAAVRKVAPVLSKLKAMTRMDCDVITVESDEPKLVVHLLSKNRHFHMKLTEVPS